MSSPSPPTPLSGKTVLVTQPDADQSQLSERLRELGARVVPCPLVEIVSVGPDETPELQQKVDWAFDSLDEFKTLVFVSKTGVDEFCRRYAQHHDGTSKGRGGPMQEQFLADRSVFAIGKGTGARVEERLGVRPILPGVANSSSLADLLIETNQRTALGRVLILRANRGSDVLRTRLTESKVDFCELVIYVSRDVEALPASIVKSLESNQIDWITVTSSSIARSVQRLLGQWLAKGASQLVSISPQTTRVLEEVGLQPAAEAERYDSDGVVAAIEAAERRGA